VLTATPQTSYLDLKGVGKDKGKGKREKTRGDGIGTAERGEHRKEGRDWRREKTEKMGEKGRGGKKSPPRSFLKVDAYDVRLCPIFLVFAVSHV